MLVVLLMWKEYIKCGKLHTLRSGVGVQTLYKAVHVPIKTSSSCSQNSDVSSCWRQSVLTKTDVYIYIYIYIYELGRDN